MNKNSILFVVTVMFPTISFIMPMLPLQPQKEQARIEYICTLYEGGRLNGYQYVLNGFVNQELIERDIVLFQKNSEQLLVEKSCAKGFYASSMKPAFLKCMGTLFCIDAFAMGAAGCIGTYFFHDVWNSSAFFNYTDSKASAAINLESASYPERATNWKKYYQCKYDYLMRISGDDEKMILAVAPTIVFCSFINIIASIVISRRFFAALAKHNSKNKAFIQQLDKRYSHNTCIIAYLQQIGYEARR